MPLRPPPYAYRHPSKGQPLEKPTAVTAELPINVETRSLRTQDFEDERVTVALRLPFPTPGSLPAYDAMIADGVPKRVALLTIARKATDHFERTVEQYEPPGEWVAPMASTDGVLTSRRMPVPGPHSS